jgi:chromosome segregation ATPase
MNKNEQRQEKELNEYANTIEEMSGIIVAQAGEITALNTEIAEMRDHHACVLSDLDGEIARLKAENEQLVKLSQDNAGKEVIDNIIEQRNRERDRDMIAHLQAQLGTCRELCDRLENRR